jgi:hypothetical protein
MFTNEQYQLMLQKSKELKVKIEVLNSSDIVVDYLEGIILDGSIDIKNDGLIRRNLTATFIANSRTEITPNSRLWINKRLRIYIGLINYFDKTIYFNYGVFIIDNPEKSISQNGNTINIKGYDKMHLYSNPFENKTVYSEGTPIAEVVKGLGQLVGETKFLIEDYIYTLPHELQYNAGSKMETGIQDLINMYMDYQIYYNVNGYLVYETIKNRLNDPIVWEFNGITDFHIDKTIQYKYDNVKNYIKVLGQLNEDTAEQPVYESSITGLSNIYSIDNIGRRPQIFTEDKYFTRFCIFELKVLQH